MGLRPLKMYTGIDFRRQNLASIDVRLLRLKSVPALKGSRVINSGTPTNAIVRSSTEVGVHVRWRQVPRA